MLVDHHSRVTRDNAWVPDSELKKFALLMTFWAHLGLAIWESTKPHEDTFLNPSEKDGVT